MYCIIFHTMLYIPVLLLLNKHSFIMVAAVVSLSDKAPKKNISWIVYEITIPDYLSDHM